jgi:hypothetical protein
MSYNLEEGLTSLNFNAKLKSSGTKNLGKQQAGTKGCRNVSLKLQNTV